MNLLRNILSDPAWEGVQGIIAVIMLLFYLWERREQLMPLMSFIGRTGFLLIAGWLSTLIIFVPLSICAQSDEPLSSFVLVIRYKLTMIALGCLLYGTAPALAAMTTQDEALSGKRAIIVGILNGVAILVYSFLFRGGFSETLSEYNNFMQTSSFTNLIISFVIVIFLVITPIAILIGFTYFIAFFAYVGVVLGRNFLLARCRTRSDKLP